MTQLAVASSDYLLAHLGDARCEPLGPGLRLGEPGDRLIAAFSSGELLQNAGDAWFHPK
jgi:hypothetical protein